MAGISLLPTEIIALNFVSPFDLSIRPHRFRRIAIANLLVYPALALTRVYGSAPLTPFVKIANAVCLTERVDVNLAPSLHRVLGGAGHNKRPECLLGRSRVHRLTRELQIKGDMFKKSGSIMTASFNPIGIANQHTSVGGMLGHLHQQLCF